MSRAMYGTGDALIAMGHQVDYIFSEYWQVSGSVVPRRFTVPLQIPGLIYSLAQKGKQYDVVEIHEPLAAAYCFNRKINQNLPPVVLFSHGLEKRNQLAELAYRRQKYLPVSLPLRFLRITVLQAMYGVRHCDHVICLNSEDTAYLQRIGVDKNRITQADNGVESQFLLAGEVLAQASLSRSGILFLGSWVLRKGTLDLVPAISQVMQRHPSLQFTIAGCGFDADTVVAYFAQDIRSQIQVIPKISSNEELIDIYRQHSILVLPSYFEGQPLTMFEAAAMGLAIVTTNICGMADFIENGINGLTVPVGDVESLTQSLDHLVSNETLARSLGEAARQKVQVYSWKRAAEKIAKAYQQAIDDASKKN
ncbi:glycosyltransferase family 4 protein [Anabaena lutea]|uniref:Glycosyltransferase family 4 protein n=1 Tax=Anabaena lutea FACHB-196 TaxID=2692881 RepID=A0ABR8FIR4_9NOST|nr:glycosyltransferase family 4 protein [Anabaena lutea]MBD2568824.1 glycosyltransferase family 4 protein [Anabaena lutea FACHB-196]